MRISLSKIIFVVLFAVVLFNPLKEIYEKRDSFFSRGYSKQYEQYRKLYYSSQYVQKKNPSIIPDGALESFAGGAFLRGMNPILIVHDQPPLGRYIIALSILLFDNSATIPIFLLILSLLGVFLVAQEVLKNMFLSLIPVAIFANEPLFLLKFQYVPLLEPIQLPFIIFAIYFFIKGLQEKKFLHWFLLTSLMLGFVVSIRFFTLGATLLAGMVVLLFYHYRFGRKTKMFVFTLPLSLVVLFLSYFVTMRSGYSPLQIPGVQKYILFYHKSKFILPFSFFDLLLFNRWHTWWGERTISFDPQWILVWPISYISSILNLFLALFKKIALSKAEQVVMAWIVLYSLFLSLGYTSTRYFLPLLPFTYIMATSFAVKMYKIVRRRR